MRPNASNNTSLLPALPPKTIIINGQNIPSPHERQPRVFLHQPLLQSEFMPDAFRVQPVCNRSAFKLLPSSSVHYFFYSRTSPLLPFSIFTLTVSLSF